MTMRLTVQKRRRVISPSHFGLVLQSFIFQRLLILGALAGMAGIPCYCGQQDRIEKPLPVLDEFLREVKNRLHSDDSLLRSYTYKEKETTRSLDGKGNLQKTEEKIYDVYPSPEPDQTYRRLIAKDGKPVSQKEIEKQDRENNKKLNDYARKLEREGTGRRERRLAKEAEEKRKEEKAIDDLFRIYEIIMEGREWIDKHPAIVLSFKPRPGVKPQTDEGKTLAKIAGRAWISEREFEVIRIEARLIDDITFGWGLVSRLNKGAMVALLRRKINNEIWLPAEARFTGRARLLLLKSMNLDLTSRYYDFRKFVVKTEIRYGKD
jgi:hypothetical protein